MPKRVTLPVEGDAKVVADHAHEVDFSVGGKKALKFGLNSVRGRVVDKVICKVCKVEGWVAGKYLTREDTRRIERFLEANILKVYGTFDVPVFGTATKTINGFHEEPVGI